MPPKNWIQKEALANGYLEGLSYAERQIIYARMATGRPPFGIPNPNSQITGRNRRFTYYNLGRTNGEDLTFDVANEDDERCVPEGWMLLGFYRSNGDDEDTESSATHHDLNLGRVHFWMINGLVIGDVGISRNVPIVEGDFGWQGKFSSARSKAQVHKALQRAIKKGEKDVTEGIPVIPSYATRKYVRSDGVQEVEGPVHVAIRFVNHLEERAEFPSATQLVFEASSDFNDVLQQVDEFIRDWAADGSTSEHEDLEEFFEDVKGWGWELWVLPQGEEKLEKYQNGNLGQFMEESEGDEAEAALYMEAHLMVMKSEPKSKKRKRAA